jgi:caffeoyl-CoA O-methyltransferase
MDEKCTQLTPALYRYLAEHCRRDPVLAALAEETSRLGSVGLMQVAAEQGALITLLVRALGVRSAVEVGTFTGYSAICIARGLADHGRLISCELNGEWAAIARRYFERAGLADRIELRLGPAMETLRSLPSGTTFDFGFIDADKTGYRGYYEEILGRLRPNALLMLDNVLWMGQVIDPHDQSESTQAIREINEYIAADERVESVMLPVSDGITIMRKRAPGECIGGARG